MTALIIISILAIIGVCTYFAKYYINKKQIDPDLNQVFDDVEKLKEQYISHNDMQAFLFQYKDLYNECCGIFVKTDKVKRFIDIYSNFEKHRKKHNKTFIDNELMAKAELFNDIDGKSLDKQQRIACVVNEDANLVVAGAGSGKTLTICGKVKYLIDKGVNPNQILCISFTNKVCDELMDRLEKVSGEKIDVMTFHKLGLKFLKGTKEKFSIADENQTEQLLQKAFSGARDKDVAIMELNALILAENYIKDHLSNNDGQMVTIKNVIDHVKKISKMKAYERDSVQLETLSNEKVKSQHELDIANFLFLNGIKYEYEQQYKFKNDEEFFQYKPDFYLPDYDVYIEHFGIDKSGKATWLKDPEKIKQYSDEMNKKIEFHKENNNNLICTYSYESDELLVKLSDKLREYGVDFTPCSGKVIELFNNIGDYESSLIKVISSFIKLFKNRGYGLNKFNEFDNPYGEYKPTPYERYLLKVIRAVYIEYQNSLQELDLIDFDDMIIKANKLFKKHDFDCKYKYIIVDEYQDVSIGKVDLLKNIINITDAKLIAVGDDWQSIYRFAGSEVTLISNFKKFFKHSEIMKIEKTYRNSIEVINVSGGFIQKNENQIKKALLSDKHESNPVEVVSYNDKTLYIPHTISQEERNEFIKRSTDDGRYKPLIQILDKIDSDGKKNALLLVRNNDDYSIVRFWVRNKNSKLTYVENPTKQLIFKYKDIEVTCMTMHKSKGLESDAVIIFDLREGYRGLPDSLGDEGILRFVIASVEPIDFAEDRRLFYVALTRTKGKVYILNRLREQSRFIDEITENEEVLSDCELYRCPLCNGYLVKIDQYGFYGCSNYLKDQCTYKIRAKDNESLVKVRSAIDSLLREQEKDEVYLKGTIKELSKHTAPKGNPSIKAIIDIEYNDVVVGDVVVYINADSGYDIEDYKLARFTIAVDPVNHQDPFDNFNAYKKKFEGCKLLINAVTYDKGQTFELNKKSSWFYKKIQ